MAIMQYLRSVFGAHLQKHSILQTRVP